MSNAADKRKALEQAIRDEIKAEQLAKRAEWRRTHQTEISAYNKKYYQRKKAALLQEKGDADHDSE